MSSRGDHVRGIEAAAEPRLDHRVLNSGCGESHERGCREQLELRHRALIAGGPVGNLRSLLDALQRLLNASSEIGSPRISTRSRQRGDVRGDVGAGRRAVRLEQRGGHPGDRGLAVGPDDVDRGEAVLRHPEQSAEPPHPLQPELPAQDLAAMEDLFRGSGYPPRGLRVVRRVRGGVAGRAGRRTRPKRVVVATREGAGGDPAKACGVIRVPG